MSDDVFWVVYAAIAVGPAIVSWVIGLRRGVKLGRMHERQLQTDAWQTAMLEASKRRRDRQFHYPSVLPDEFDAAHEAARKETRELVADLNKRKVESLAERRAALVETVRMTAGQKNASIAQMMHGIIRSKP